MLGKLQHRETGVFSFSAEVHDRFTTETRRARRKDRKMLIAKYTILNIQVGVHCT
jgi:hypothetical protein